VCRTCRYFIGRDEAPHEIEEEWRLIAGAIGMTLHTDEPLTGADGYVDAAKIVPTVTRYSTMEAAIAHRMNLDPWAFGLCEKGGPTGYSGAGPVRLIHRDSGLTADENGARLDQCAGWQPISKLAQLLNKKRHPKWREFREKALSMRANAKPSYLSQKCPWHPAREFRFCCGRA
jgi:hypothetical protein